MTAPMPDTRSPKRDRRCRARIFDGCVTPPPKATHRRRAQRSPEFVSQIACVARVFASPQSDPAEGRDRSIVVIAVSHHDLATARYATAPVVSVHRPGVLTFFIWETCPAAPLQRRRRHEGGLRVQRREPALRSSRAERVAADLEHEILSARLPVGAHLGRRSEIMDRFGISPTVMNETLRILRDRDLVTVRPGPGGGVTVASAPPQVRVGALGLSFQPSTPHPLDLFEARLYLEIGLTKAAFGRATADDIAAMRSAMVAMRASADAAQFFEAMLAFHGVVAAAAHIPVLEGMAQPL